MTIVLVPSLIVFLIINRCYEIHPNGAPNTVGVQNCVIIKNVRVTMVVFDAKLTNALFVSICMVKMLCLMNWLILSCVLLRNIYGTHSCILTEQSSGSNPCRNIVPDGTKSTEFF